MAIRDPRTAFNAARAEYKEEAAKLQAEMERALAPLLSRRREAAGRLVRHGLDSFFREHPQLTSVSWTQSSDHYNDEDEYWDVDLEYDQIEINGRSYYDITDYVTRKSSNFKGYEALPGHEWAEPLYRPIADALHHFEGELEEMFGDFARVTITRDGVTVERWEY